MQKRTFIAILLVLKTYFSQKKLKQMRKGKSIGIGKSNQHELVTW